MTQLEMKYKKLRPIQRKEVLDLIDFLLQKDHQSGNLENYKNKILQVSTWTNEDLQEFENTKKIFSGLAAQTW